MTDLVAVVADADYEQVLETLLGPRAPALGIRPPTVRVVREANRDPGCWRNAGRLLAPLRGTFRHALVLFDAAFDGSPGAAALRADVGGELARAGWGDDAAVVVVDPEIEAWVFTEATEHLERALQWDPGTLRVALQRKGLAGEGPKPPDPKRALTWAARERRVHLNPRWFGQLAASVSVRGCRDPAFAQLTAALGRWFPAGRPPVPGRDREAGEG